MLSKRVTEEHLGRTIHAMEIKGKGAAMIHPGKRRFEADSVANAIILAKEWIDHVHARNKEARRMPQIGTFSEYVTALQILDLYDHELTLLGAHKAAPNRRMTATELANSADWSSFSSANAHYGHLGKKLAIQIGLPIDEANGEAFTSTIATYHEETSEWEMHIEIAEALDHLNIN